MWLVVSFEKSLNTERKTNYKKQMTQNAVDKFTLVSVLCRLTKGIKIISITYTNKRAFYFTNYLPYT